MAKKESDEILKKIFEKILNRAYYRKISTHRKIANKQTLGSKQNTKNGFYNIRQPEQYEQTHTNMVPEYPKK